MVGAEVVVFSAHAHCLPLLLLLQMQCNTLPAVLYAINVGHQAISHLTAHIILVLLPLLALVLSALVPCHQHVGMLQLPKRGIAVLVLTPVATTAAPLYVVTPET
jgi:hypothetical protein